MILIKLGGSIITNKGKPQSARRKTIDNILKQIKKINEPKILVHGGGSYGHYWSVKYGMHTKPAKYSLKGLSVVKNSMIELDKIILDNATKNKLNPYSLPPTDFMNGNKPIRNKIQKIGEIARSGLTPSNIWRCIMVWSEKILHFIWRCDNDYNWKDIEAKAVNFCSRCGWSVL